MAGPRVGILMGSRSDMPVMEKASALLTELGVEHEVRVMSAHRTPALVAGYATGAADRGLGVVIAAAGGAAHLAGVVAAHTLLPVIGVPIATQVAGGLDSLLSTVQMPRGVPVATVSSGRCRERGTARGGDPGTRRRRSACQPRRVPRAPGPGDPGGRDQPGRLRGSSRPVRPRLPVAALPAARRRRPTVPLDGPFPVDILRMAVRNGLPRGTRGRARDVQIEHSDLGGDPTAPKPGDPAARAGWHSWSGVHSEGAGRALGTRHAGAAPPAGAAAGARPRSTRPRPRDTPDPALPPLHHAVRDRPRVRVRGDQRARARDVAGGPPASRRAS